MAELVDAVRPLSAVDTQNVDGLHRRADSQAVVDLHGRIADVCCLGCAAATSRRDLPFGWIG